MAGFYGMDVEQVRELARQLFDKASQIDDLAQQLTSKLTATDWKGPDSDRFRDEWMTNHQPALQRVAEALRDASQKANNNAQEQENISI